MKNDFVKKNKILGINMFYILSLVPIILFSYYKNGFLVYKAGYFGFLKSTEYLIVPIVVVVLSYVFEAYYYLLVKKEDDNNNVVNSIVPFINLLCYLVAPPSAKLYVTIPLIILLDVIMKFLDNKLTVNRVALFNVILFFILSALHMGSYLNPYEASLKVVENDPTKLFLGMGVGGIGVTSSLFALVGYFTLLFNKYYKKDIPVVSLIAYFLVSILLYFGHVLTFNELLVNTFNSGVIFAMVFVASLTNATPMVKSGRIIYAVIVGIISGIMVNLVKWNMGIYVGILVMSIISPLLNKFKLYFEN